MLCATNGVRAEAKEKPSPSNSAARMKNGAGQEDRVGNALVKARKEGGIKQALANVMRPHISVWVPV